MESLIMAMLVLAALTWASIVSIRDPRPGARPREWSIGTMIDRTTRR